MSKSQYRRGRARGVLRQVGVSFGRLGGFSRSHSHGFLLARSGRYHHLNFPTTSSFDVQHQTTATQCLFPMGCGLSVKL